MTLLKSIVVVLALANVGYFLWTRGIAHPLEAAPEASTTTLKLTSEVPATILKGVGIDLFSIGKVGAEPGDEIVADEDTDPAAPSYRRLLISEGRAVGAIVLGNHPEVVTAVTAAVKNRAEISPAQVAELRRGDWGVLKNLGRVSEPAGA